jgi:hypothetical protein
MSKGLVKVTQPANSGTPCHAKLSQPSCPNHASPSPLLSLLKFFFIPLTHLTRATLADGVKLPTQQVAGHLVADAEAGARGEHAGGDVHGKELLEEQLGGVGDVDLRDARLVVAGAAFAFALLELTGCV